MNSKNRNGIRVALATCHDKHNFGSMLQAFATQAYLEEQGFDVRTVDKTGLKKAIQPGRTNYYLRNILDMQMYAEKVPFVEHRIRQKIPSSFSSNMKARHRAFDEFSRMHFHLSRKCWSFEELAELSKEYDAIVVGSDQLWLPVNIGGRYFTLEWADAPVRKISYATSTGMSDFDEHYLSRLHDFLADYHAVSVREQSGAELVEKATGKSPMVTCDPTMLLSREEWQKISNGSYGELPSEPYLFCYFMGDNAWQRECAEKIARERNLKIAAVAHNDSYIPADNDYADYYCWNAGPAEWLALIEHASFVLTDSFHGSVFSNIFQVPFISFRRHGGNTKQSTNSRIDTLLGVLGLDYRICESAGNFDDIASTGIDFDTSQKKLEDYRAQSASWLLEALSMEKAASRHIEVNHKEDCCGCSACAATCPIGCITMEFDAEGCEYPLVDTTRCLDCGKCLKACPIINVESDSPHPQQAFVVQHKDDAILRQSTSGGAFTAFATTIIKMGGVVFGAGYDRDGLAEYDSPLNVRHMPVERVEDLRFFRNSKYVQSEMGDTYRQVKELLDAGRLVLFSGTPCQCEGLYDFLGKNKPSGLFIVDFVCHAVPARAFFKAYLSWLESRGIDSQSVLFRDKGRWGYEYPNLRVFDQIEPYDPADSAQQVPHLYSSGVESDPYLRAFFGDLSDRPACYRCVFKKRYRVTDITMWDCFDAWRYGDGFDDDRGATRVLVHTEGGRELFDASVGMLRHKEIDADQAARLSRELTHSVTGNPKRNEMFRDLEVCGDAEFIDRWFPDSPSIVAQRELRALLQQTGAYSAAKEALCKIRERG